MPTIEMLTELPGPKSRAIIARKERVVCDPVDLTGRLLASEHFALDPDIVILGKALGSGYPLSAVVGRTEIMDAPGPSSIGGTYVGNPVACAAANAVMDVIEEEGLIERAEVVGKAIRSRWEDLAGDVPQIGDIRGLGSMIGVEMVSDRETKEPDGAYVLRHLVPLVITDEQLDEALDVLADAALAARGT